MLPEVEQYFKSLEEAQAAHAAAYGPVQDAWNQAHRATNDRSVQNQLRNRYQPIQNALTAVRDAAQTLAWTQLLTSDDPLVRFISANCGGDYRETYSEHILRELPAPLSRLREIAQQRNWCGEFDSFVQRAMAQGAIDDGRTPERRAFESWLTTHFGRSYVSTLTEHMDKVVAAEAQAYVDAHPVTPVEPVAPLVKLDVLDTKDTTARCEGCGTTIEAGDEYCDDCDDSDDEYDDSDEYDDDDEED